jgi:hypothetical protein
MVMGQGSSCLRVAVRFVTAVEQIAGWYDRIGSCEKTMRLCARARHAIGICASH